MLCFYIATGCNIHSVSPASISMEENKDSAFHIDASGAQDRVVLSSDPTVISAIIIFCPSKVFIKCQSSFNLSKP